MTARLEEGSITIERPGRKPKVRKLSSRDWQTLTHVLKDSRFDELEPRYGCPGSCDDFAECHLEVRQGASLHKVVMYSPPASAIELSVVQRFMSVWRTVKLLGDVRVKDVCP